MSDLSRWSISELQARYTLEPQLTDIFVEGSFDKEILSTSFAQSTKHETFYEIDVVDVPGDLVAKHGLTSGNKQRVIALAAELESLGPNVAIKCLIDRDLDHWFTDTANTDRLRWTLFCSIESHFITSEIVAALVSTTAGAKIQDTKAFTESLELVLKTLYALRLADRELGFSLRWVALRKYLSREQETIQFDMSGYVTATLGGTSVLGKKSVFLKSVKAWLGKFNCDVRLAARGHDYTELLAWAVQAFGGHKAFNQQSAIERLLVLIASSDLRVFQELSESLHTINEL